MASSRGFTARVAEVVNLAKKTLRFRACPSCELAQIVTSKLFDLPLQIPKERTSQLMKSQSVFNINF